MRKQKERERHRGKLKYGGGILALSVLIAAALWLPQIFFDVQDGFRDGEISLAEQEQMDILTLGTGYELSLYRRMANFAEGLAEGRRYYVDEQDKEVTEEMLNFLLSDDGLLNQDRIIQIFGSLVLTRGGNMSSASLDRWKQYLIYSDDYAQGVNFILWLFELTMPEGDQVIILMDAQDNTVYAMKTMDGEGARYVQYVVDEVVGNAHENAALWMALNICYNVFDWNNAESFLTIAYDLDDMSQEFQNKFLTPMKGTITDSAGYDVILMIPRAGVRPLSMQDGTPWYGRKEDGSLYYLLPFRENLLNFTIDSRPEQSLPDTIIGIREIYKLIPEF